MKSWAPITANARSGGDVALGTSFAVFLSKVIDVPADWASWSLKVDGTFQVEPDGTPSGARDFQVRVMADGTEIGNTTTDRIDATGNSRVVTPIAEMTGIVSDTSVTVEMQARLLVADNYRSSVRTLVLTAFRTS